MTSIEIYENLDDLKCMLEDAIEIIEELMEESGARKDPDEVAIEEVEKAISSTAEDLPDPGEEDESVEEAKANPEEKEDSIEEAHEDPIEEDKKEEVVYYGFGKKK